MLFAWWWYGELKVKMISLCSHFFLNFLLRYCLPKSAVIMDSRPYSARTLVKWLEIVAADMSLSGLMTGNLE